jgi:hypothetical protein
MALKKRKIRKPPKGFRTWPAYMASIRPNARKKRKAAAPRAKSSPSPAPVMAPKSKRAAVRRIASKARSVASRARGAVSRSGVVPFVTGAATDAAGIVAGKVIARSIRARTPIAAGTPLASLAEIAIGVVLGIVVGKRNKAWGQRLAVGAMIGPIEQTLRQFNVPFIAPALGEDGFIVSDLSDAELIEAYTDGEPSRLSGGNFVEGGTMEGYTSGGVPTATGYEFGNADFRNADFE